MKLVRTLTAACAGLALTGTIALEPADSDKLAAAVEDFSDTRAPLFEGALE